MERPRTNRNVVWRCTYHVVWCPKYRRGVLVRPVETRLEALLRDIACDLAVHPREIEVMPDHVHVLMDVDPQFGVQRVVRVMKGRTSRILRSDFGALRTRIPTLWTNSYFVSTVGGAPLDIVKQYIANQKRGDLRERIPCPSLAPATGRAARMEMGREVDLVYTGSHDLLYARAVPARVVPARRPPCAEHSNTKRVSRA
jgi:putative transposase